MPARLAFVTSNDAFDKSPVRLFAGRRERLLSAPVLERVPTELAPMWETIVKSVERGDDGGATTAWTPQGKVIVVVLSEQCSRHNSQTRSWSLARLIRVGGKQDVGLCIALDQAEHAWAAAAAVGRAYPTFSASRRSSDKVVRALLLASDAELPTTGRLLDVAEGVRKAASWVDAPPNTFNTNELVAAAEKVAAEIGASVEIIRGEALRDRGFGGIWGVGKGSRNPPALVAIRYRPEGATGEGIGFVGKGIVYDTGGLSLKSKTGMVGMKTDMGGAAAVLGATWAAGRLGLKRNLTTVLCVAENSIGKDATRPDDVLDMFSGRTVEVNNTDAEGRLVLADGLAWLAKTEAPQTIVDCATLTGAQLVSTGKRHAAVYTNNESLEDALVALGKRTGDLVHPLPYVPEFYRKEFASRIADMRNSVKDRANAQSSCAGQFLNEHLRAHKGQWAHVDLAGPAVSSGRGTGFGVVLLLGLLGLLEA